MVRVKIEILDVDLIGLLAIIAETIYVVSVLKVLVPIQSLIPNFSSNMEILVPEDQSLEACEKTCAKSV